jgi:hypothetical protein
MQLYAAMTAVNIPAKDHEAPALAMKAAWRVDECQCELAETQRACGLRAFAHNSLNDVRLASRSWIFKTLIAIERKPVPSFC